MESDLTDVLPVAQVDVCADDSTVAVPGRTDVLPISQVGVCADDSTGE